MTNKFTKTIITTLGAASFILAVSVANAANPASDDIQGAALAPQPTPKPTLESRFCERNWQSEKWEEAQFGENVLICDFSFSKVKSLKGVPQIRRSARIPEYTHQLTLHQVVFRKAGWNLQQVRDRAFSVALIMAQCGIWLRRTQIVIADSFNGHIDVIRNKPNGRQLIRDLTVAKFAQSSHRPMIFYIGAVLDGKKVSFGRPRLAVKNKHPAIGTAYIIYETTTSSYKKARLPGYNVDTHELGHILMNAKRHNNENKKNFFHEYFSQRTNDIPAAFCRKMKSDKTHEFIQPIPSSG